MIYTLKEAASRNTQELGGKAWSLAQMVDNDFKVPDGFVISAQNYGVMSDDLKQQIQSAFVALESEYVAVRSSAIAEDGHEAAWAGQLDTFLNVTNDTLIESVEKCWKSLHSQRAQSYAEQHGVDLAEQKVAVIVQKMVQSDVAGVAFSVHPVTHNANELIIEAAYGLGEAVVSGQVSPDNYTLTKNPREITDKYIATQTRKLALSDEGKNEWQDITEAGAEQKLTDEQILGLAETVIALESFYGFAVDVEWAYVGNELYITQSRPITTLNSDNSEHKPLYEPQEVLFRWGPIPGRWFYIGDFVDAVFHHFKSIYKGTQPPKTQVLFNEDQVLWLCSDKDFRTFGTEIFETLVKHPEIHNNLGAYWANALTQTAQLKDDLANLEITSFDECQMQAQRLYDGMIAFWIPTLLGEFANYGSDAILRRELAKYITDERELGKAMQVLTAPKELSFMQQADVALLHAHDLASYAKEYGWLENGYGGVVALDEQYFADRKKNLNPDLEQHLKQLFEDSETQKKTYISTYAIPEYVQTICELIISLMLQQDQRKAEMLKLQAYKERFLEKVAQLTSTDINELRNISLREFSMLVDEDQLNEYVRERFDVLFGFEASESTVSQLSADKARHYWDRYSKDEITDEVTSLSGTIASRGAAPRTTARVCVVLHPDQADHFMEGDVLVTTMTSPEYVDLMRLSSAVVTDTGGLTSHAAIFARELNVPCIVGTRVATGQLQTGDMVEVDTHAGIVRKINKG